MARHAVIGIGGTGARCVEALVHLCAAGLGPAEEIYLLVIDTDEGNGNLTQTNEVLNYYRQCRQGLGLAGVPIFQTGLVCPDGGVRWSPVDNANMRLGDFINYHLLTPKLQKVADLLYSDKELTTPLKEGFRGHCSVGAPVMADIEQKAVAQIQRGAGVWHDVVNHLNAAVDGGNIATVFIFASGFGGTGASGFPTVAQMFRNLADPAHYNPVLLHGGERLKIGGCLLLPYFRFKLNAAPGEMVAHPEFFNANTNAAMRHYAQIWENGMPYNAVYFLGSDNPSDEGRPANAIGGTEQRNPAHYLELIAALACLHFQNNAGAAAGCYHSGRDWQGPKEEEDLIKRGPISADDLPPQNKIDLRENKIDLRENKIDLRENKIDLRENKIDLRVRNYHLLLDFSHLGYAFCGFYLPLLNLQLGPDLVPFHADNFRRGELFQETERQNQDYLRRYFTSYFRWAYQLHRFSEDKPIKILNRAVLEAIIDERTEQLVEENLDDTGFRNLSGSFTGKLKRGLEYIWELMCDAQANPQIRSGTGRLIAMLYSAVKQFCNRHYQLSRTQTSQEV